MTARNLKLFHLPDLVKERRFSDGSHDLTNSPSKWPSKDWKTSKPFKNGHTRKVHSTFNLRYLQLFLTCQHDSENAQYQKHLG